MDDPVSTEIARIVRSLSADDIDHADGDVDGHETVHEVRKRCKGARTAVRPGRGVLPTYSGGEHTLPGHGQDRLRRSRRVVTTIAADSG
jgi:hypothetical protein